MISDSAKEPDPSADVTRLLNTIGAGNPNAAHELLGLVYQELRRLAASKMKHELAGQTLQPTALVHEAYLRLVGNGDQTWESRRHFFGAAAEAMRRILIENARRKGRQRHGGDLIRIDFEKIDIAIAADDDALLLLDEALNKLEKEDPMGAELIRLRFFVGLPNIQASKLLGISERTGKRTWAYARAWLYEELQKNS